jgi:hypothetical protein
LSNYFLLSWASPPAWEIEKTVVYHHHPVSNIFTVLTKAPPIQENDHMTKNARKVLIITNSAMAPFADANNSLGE